MTPADRELVIQAILLAPLALALWTTVIVWCRRMNAADAMDDLLPLAADIAHVEASLPAYSGRVDREVAR